MPTSDSFSPSPGETHVFDQPPSFSKMLGDYRRNLIDEGFSADHATAIAMDAAERLHTGELPVGNTR